MRTLLLMLLLVLPWLPVSHAQTPAQLINGNRTHAGATNYGLSTGTATAYVLTLNAAIPGYVEGACYLFKAHVANTGAATLNVNARGSKPFSKNDGTGALVPLTGGEFVVGQPVFACDNGTAFVLQTFGGTGGGSSAGHVIYDETTALTARPGLAMSGGGVACGDDPANNRTLCTITGTGTGGDASTNTSISVDNEIALFSGTSGKTLKRATGTGLAGVTNGVLGMVTTLAGLNTAILDANLVPEARTFTITGATDEITCTPTGPQDLTANRTWTCSFAATTDFQGQVFLLTRGTTLPGTCAVSQLFFDTDAAPGQNLHGCTATNTWTPLGGGGSSALQLDLGSDTSIESLGLTKIVTIGDGRSIVTEAAPDVVRFDFTNIPTMASPNVFTNTFVVPRVQPLAVLSGTLTPNCDTTDIALVDVLTANVAVAAPVCTPPNPRHEHDLTLHFPATAAPHCLTWNSVYTARNGLPLPLCTSGDGTTDNYVLFRRNNGTGQWAVMATTFPGSVPTSRNLPVTGVKLNDGVNTPAILDRSGFNDSLLFDAATKMCAIWPFDLPVDYHGSPSVVLDYTMLSAGGVGGIALELDVMHVKTGVTVAANDYDTVNTCTAATVPANNLRGRLTCPLVTVDTWAAGEPVRLRLCRNITAPTASGFLAIFNGSFRYVR